MGCKQILKYPSFENGYGKKFYEEEFYNFVKACFSIEDIQLIELPEILSYASVINAILEGDFLCPFYNELKEFPYLRKKIEEGLKEKSKRIKELLNSLIRIEYSTVMKNNIQD